MSKSPKNTKRTPKNLDAMPTKYIKEIVDHPHHLGRKGTDYAPVIHELQDILFQRQQLEFERQMNRHRIEEKKAFKAWASSHKRKQQ